ncbi:SLC13 family permease, partial [bacterium]|nr:SLC13 family permease [bacterium]
MEMDPAALFTLVVTILAAVLLIFEILRPDLVALLVLIALGLSGTVDSQKIFAGFSGPAVMTLIAISMIGAAMHKTGVSLVLSRWMLRVGNKNDTTLTLVTFLTAAGLSLMMNNIAVVGILLPAVMTLTRSTGVAPSKLMLPLAYGTILGGMATLFTTSNMVVSGALRDAGFAPFGVLDFLPIGLPLIIIGAVYMLTVGRKLLPTATTDSHAGLLSQLGARLTDLYNLKSNLAEIIVLPDSPLAGKTISAGDWRKRVGLTIVGIIRHGQSFLGPKRGDIVEAGDRLMVHGLIDPAKLTEFHLTVVQGNPTVPTMVNEVIKLAEVIIPPHSSMNGKT